MQHMIEIDAEIDASGEIHAKRAGTYRPGPVHLVVFLEAEDQERASFSEQPEPEDFAGIWSDITDQDFRDFLDDIGDRRRGAFAARTCDPLNC